MRHRLTKDQATNLLRNRMTHHMDVSMTLEDSAACEYHARIADALMQGIEALEETEKYPHQTSYLAEA